MWSDRLVTQPGELDNQVVILVNNGIHAGESCGIDASLHFAESLVAGKYQLKNVVICIIPAYNIGGMHNRSCCSRANQNGPVSKGFRGNARNLDLNRDFTKAVALNTRSFFTVFNQWKPHLFIDTHSTNGADYPAELTLIFSQSDAFEGSLTALAEEFRKEVFRGLDKRKVRASPFVNIYGKTPDHGFAAFKETPIYSTGYTSSNNTLSIVSEAHMLKPYRERVEATFDLLNVVSEYAESNHKEIVETVHSARKETGRKSYHAIRHELDSLSRVQLPFEGYQYSYLPSEVTGLQRLKYDSEQEVTWDVDYYPVYKPSDSVEIPRYYLVPDAWLEVLRVLRSNAIEMKSLDEETELSVEGYRIADYKTSDRPYEGHYYHYDIRVTMEKEIRSFHPHYQLIPTDQAGMEFIVNCLEPHAEGSLFSWNFFDPILQQKEWFSAYVFEDTAKELLDNDPDLKRDFEQMKESNPEIKNDAWSQLYWIYRHSPYYEESHNKYPVYRIMD